jgi:hypothetical protein
MAGAAALLAVLLLGWMATGPAVGPTEDARRPAAPVKGTLAEPAPTRSHGEEGPREEEVPAEPDPPSVAALALVAEAAGEGVVRCALPPGAPDGLPRGFRRAERHGRVVVASVEQPEGRALLKAYSPPLPDDPDDDELREHLERAHAPPFATAVWHDAWPGEEGRCTVEPVEQVTLRGRIDFVDGPVAGQLHGCGGSRPVNDDGTFEVVVDVGPPCGLSFRDKGMGGEVMVDPASPPAEIVVPEPAERSMAERLDVLREELEYLQSTPDPVALALEADDLDDEVRAVLTEWEASERAEREVRIESLARMADFFEEQGH